MTAVFIACSRDDRLASASLADELRSRGMTVWLSDGADAMDAAVQVDRDEQDSRASSGTSASIDAMPDDSMDWPESDMDLASAIDALDSSADELLAVTQRATRKAHERGDLIDSVLARIRAVRSETSGL